MEEDDMTPLVPVDLTHNVNKLTGTKFVPLGGKYDDEDLKERSKYISEIKCDGLWYWDRTSKQDGKEKVICVGGSLSSVNPKNKQPQTIELSYLEGYLPIEDMVLYKTGEVVGIWGSVNPLCYREQLFEQNKEPYKSATEQLKRAVTANEWILTQDVPMTVSPDDFVTVRCKCSNLVSDIVELNIPVTSIMGIENTGIWGDPELKDSDKGIVISSVEIGPVAKIEETDESMVIGNSINNNNNNIYPIGVKIPVAALGSLSKRLIRPVTKVSVTAVKKLKGFGRNLPKLFGKGKKKAGELAVKGKAEAKEFGGKVKEKVPGALVDVATAGLAGATYAGASTATKKGLTEGEVKKDETKEKSKEELEKLKEEKENTQQEDLKEETVQSESLIRYDSNYASLDFL